MLRGLKRDTKQGRSGRSFRLGLSGVIISLAVVSVLLIVSGVVLAYWKGAQNEKNLTGANKATASRVSSTEFGGDANWSISVPKGWKRLETQQFGISFIVPKKWQALEQYRGLKNSTVGAITVGSSKEFKDRTAMMVVSTPLDTYVKQAEGLYKKFSSDVHTKTEKGTWYGYDARRVTIHSSDPHDAVTLFVRIGKFTYQLPYANSYQSNVFAGRFNDADYKKFVESIRVKKS